MKREKRTEKFQMCLTKKEKALALSIAQEHGITISELFRNKAFAELVPPPVNLTIAKTYWELNKIGVNLNQLTKIANTAMQYEKANPIEYNQILAEIEKVYNLIQEVRSEIIQSQPPRWL
jgi:hypothetical protein